MSTTEQETRTVTAVRPSRLKQSLKTIFFMFIITVVFISVLAFVYLSTRETIAINENLYLIRAVLTTVAIEVPENPGAVVELFERRAVERRTPDGRLFFEILSPDGEIESYVILVSEAGLWGAIVATVGLQSDMETLTGIQFVEQNETPGLGGRIAEEWFTEQFRGRAGPFRTIQEGETPGDNEFQAVTGATISSEAVLRILNNTIEDAPRIIESGS